MARKEKKKKTVNNVAVIDAAEILAGLAFLERHASPRYADILLNARLACEAAHLEAKLDEVRRGPVSDLNISIRAVNGLRSAGCVTVRDVERMMMTWSDKDIINSNKKGYINKRCIRETRSALNVALARQIGL